MSQIADLNRRLLIAERERDSAREENVRLRNKLLEWAAECSACDGKGIVTVTLPDSPGSRTLVERQEECGDCADIREILA